MNPIPTIIKTTMGIIIFSLIATPLNSLADSFVKTKELTSTFKNGILKISASEDGRYVFIKDGNRDYWLMDVIRPFLFHKIINDKRSSLTIEEKPIREQWHNEYIIFFYYEKTEFYNVQSQKIDRRYPLKLTGFGNSEIFWSEKHQRFIVGTKVFSVDSDTQIDPGQDWHAHQTGLLMTENGDDYITAGYHDASIMRWTLPDGELKETWHLGSWYASRNVSDTALIDNHLLTALNNGEIEARSIEDGNVLWSASPCSSFFTSTKPYFRLNGLSAGNSIIHNKLIFYRCDEAESKFGFIEKQENDWKLHKITLPSTGNSSLEYAYYLDSVNKAILGLYNGQVLLYDLKNKSIDQVIVPKSAEGDGPALFTYLKADKLLVVVNDKTVDIYQYQ